MSDWADAMNAASVAVYGKDGRSMVGRERRHLLERVARAILKAREEGFKAGLEESRAEVERLTVRIATMQLIALDYGARNLLRIAARDADAEGWAKVSPALWKHILLANLPKVLVTLRSAEEGGFMQVTPAYRAAVASQAEGGEDV